MAALKQSLSETKKPAGDKKSLLRVVPRSGEAVAKKEEAVKKPRRKVG
jgi:hypothetical protein